MLNNMFRKRFSRFSVGSYRKLEIMLLILRGKCSVDALLPELPIRRPTLYHLLRTYRLQGLIRNVGEKRTSKGRYGSMRVVITRKGMRWLSYMLLKEYILLKEQGLPTMEVDHYINKLTIMLNGRDLLNHLFKVMYVRRGVPLTNIP